MVEIIHAGLVTGPDTTQEDSDRIHALAEPIARVLLNLPPEDCFNVVGSMLMTYALRFDDPVGAIGHLAANVLSSIPEALENSDKPKH